MNKEEKIIDKIRDNITDNESDYLMCDALENIIKYHNKNCDIEIVACMVLGYISRLQKENEKLEEKILNLNEQTIIGKTKIPKQDNFYDYYNYVSKDKIKNKIKELKKGEPFKEEEDGEIYEGVLYHKYTWQTLEDLLKEN